MSYSKVEEDFITQLLSDQEDQDQSVAISKECIDVMIRQIREIERVIIIL